MSSPIVNMIGQKYTRLEIISRGIAPAHAKSYARIKAVWWNWRCACGNEGVSTRSDIINGFKKSCGCLNKEAKGARSEKARQAWRNKREANARYAAGIKGLEALITEVHPQSNYVPTKEDFDKWLRGF